MEEDKNEPGSVITPSSATPEPSQPETTTPDKVEDKASTFAAASDNVAEPDNRSDIAKSDDGIRWTAPEFVSHEKSFSWYFLLFLFALALSAIIYLLIKDIVLICVIFVAAFLLGFYGARKPKNIGYALDNQGITIGRRRFAYSNFKNFSLTQEGTLYSAVLVPLRRFGTSASLYFDIAVEKEVLDLLSVYLPVEPHRLSMIDDLMRRINF